MAVSTSDPRIGQVFDGRYKIVRKLGTGGMANVYLAEDQELGRQVAIKILDDRHAQDDSFVERFRREASSAASLSHPNIVSIYDRGEAQGTYYIAMEYLDGRSVKELIVRQGPLPIALAIDYARQILAAIGFAHRNGIVHRDIKPHNALLAGDDRVKVTDFGIARSGASQMTEVGSIIGTAQYLSPEQARGAPVDQTSDLYSAGIVLYEMLTGTVPFTGETPLEIAMKHLSAVPEPPSAKRPGIPRDLDLVTLRALAKRPEERYHSAEEMDADLARVARGVGVGRETSDAATAVLAGSGTAIVAPLGGALAPSRAAPPAYPPAPPRVGYYGYQPPRRRRRPIWPWLLAILLVAGGGAGGWYAYTRIQDELNKNRPVAVPFVTGLRELQAVLQIEKAHLKPHVVRVPDSKVEVTYVIDQTPAAGERIDRGNSVTFHVSTGKPKALVPRVIGKTQADAVQAIADRHLRARVVLVNSLKPPNTVIAQDPPPGRKIVEGTRVRINVSNGPKPVAVPPTVGLPYESASARLQGAGFSVARTDVDSNEPTGTVLRTIPQANTFQPRGSKITLLVSKGPQTSTVPDVTSFDQVTAVVTLRNAGFHPVVVSQDTTDPAQDGIVLTQDPQPQAEAPPRSDVTVTVGRLVAGAGPTTTETTPTTTEATPTTTAPTTTTPTQ